MTVKELISDLEKVKDKEMEVTIRINTVIADAKDIFEIEANGTSYICIDSED